MNELLELILSNPDLADTTVNTLFEKYKPLIYSVARQLLEVYKDFVNNVEFYSVAALANWKRFDSLTRVGFTEDQAMSIMMDDMKKWREVAKNSGVTVKK